MRNDIIAFINGYIVDLEKTLSCSNQSQIRQLSYSIWAANELAIYVRHNASSNEILTIESFIRKMDGYSCMNLSNSYMFSVAHDTAEDILDRFTSMERRK